MQSAFNLIALLLGLSALFGWVNARFLRLPHTIGLVVIALVVSLALIGIDLVVPQWGVKAAALGILDRIDFDDTLLKGMLGFLLFAGALHVDLASLMERGWAILLMATAGVLMSTGLIGLSLWLALPALGLDLPLIYCLIFGALIAPTDPVAVLDTLKRVHVPETLEAKFAGESLFNDGVGVVIFLILAAVAAGGGEGAEPMTAGAVALLFLEEAGGGILLGFLAGGLGFFLLRAIDDYVVEVLITLAVVAVAYAVAGDLHFSGPLAVVIAGLMIGNHGRRLAMSETTRAHLQNFWSLMDEVMNSVLFLLIGFEVLAVSGAPGLFPYLAIVIPVVLLARLVSVGLPITQLRGLQRSFTPGAVWVLTWGGLRGGISVALALSLPPGPWKGVILTLCFGVVLFSVIVQGLTMEAVIRRVVRVTE